MGEPTTETEGDLEIAVLSDVGCVRSHNEDCAGHFHIDDARKRARKGTLCVVADGMGGHRAGEVASQTAVEVVVDQYSGDRVRNAAASLARAVQAANQAIYEIAQADASRAGMGTTLVGAAILEDRAVIANIGDSRAYLINATECRQITDDHSWVGEQVRAGVLSPSQARTHPQRNLVTRALGTRPTAQTDLFELDLVAGDRLLLCTDGLTNHLSDEEIGTIVRGHRPADAARQLVDGALDRGGSDNVTVLIVAGPWPAGEELSSPTPHRREGRRSRTKWLRWPPWRK